MPGGWRSFHRRLILTINGLFLATMMVFLTVSYISEHGRHFRETFAHLDETLGVVADIVSEDDSRDRLSRLDAQLAERTTVPHRVFVVGPGGTILAAGNREVVGRSLDDSLELTRYDDAHETWFTATENGRRWVASSIPLANDRTLVLMRRCVDEREVVQAFLALHGLHAALTIVLFTGLLEIAGARAIRRPIKELTSHIEQVESGKFRFGSEIARDDEIGWLANRFTRMAERLHDVVTKRVREEKYSAAHSIARRAGVEMQEPLHRLDRDVLFLEGSIGDNEQLRSLVESLRKDHDLLVASVQRLIDIEPPDLGGN